MNRIFHLFCLLSIVAVAIPNRYLLAQDAEPSRAEQLRSLGADNIREIDRKLS